MTRTIEIPRVRWPQFLKEINQNVGSRAIRVEVENLELGDQEMANLLPLLGMDFDPGHEPEPASIEILAGEGVDEFEHRIEGPTRMYALVNDAGDIVSLSIEDGSGGKTIVYFEMLPAHPDADRVPSGRETTQQPGA